MENRIRRDYSKYRKNSVRKKIQKPKMSFKELIIVQSTVCTIILALVLLVCFVKVPFTNELRENLQSVISTDTNIDSIINSSQNIIASIDNLKNSVQTIFGGDTVNFDNIDIKEDVDLSSEDRIDEDILGQINQLQDFYGENEKKYIMQ